MRSAIALACAAVLGGFSPAWAEKADRNQSLVVESDGKQAATVDLSKKLTIISGHVSIAQGSLSIRSDRVEVREEVPGRYTVLATGLPGEPAHFRQKRDLPDEFIEADAERVDYDGGNERVKFIGAARLRVLRHGQVTDEASAAVITYDQRNDTIVFEGGAQISPGATTGKARLVFQPRNDPANPALVAKPASGAGR